VNTVKPTSNAVAQEEGQGVDKVSLATRAEGGGGGVNIGAIIGLSLLSHSLYFTWFLLSTTSSPHIHQPFHYPIKLTIRCHRWSCSNPRRHPAYLPQIPNPRPKPIPISVLPVQLSISQTIVIHIRIVQAASTGIATLHSTHFTLCSALQRRCIHASGCSSLH